MDYDLIADLELSITETAFERLEAETSSDFTRVTTTISLVGPGQHENVAGRGEDVTYDADEHDRLAETGLPELAGEYTVDSFSDCLDDLDLFPSGVPSTDAFRHYRRWALESAALDLACRQAETDLANVVGRRPTPLRFVASTRLGDPPTIDRVRALRDRVPGIELKLDPTPAWDADLIDALVALDAVRVLDLKGHYEGTDVDVPADPELYANLIEAFPDAVVEDPALTPETRPLFDEPAVRERVAWDAPIHGVSDLEALPWEPGWLNIKPSRFGSLESLFEALAWCRDRNVKLYGGGQFELGVGRGQLQLLAGLYYPDGPNDVAPGDYNEPDLPANLPSSPLELPAERSGFRW